jgi:5-(carboxyamino)imidazole ribonucleotide mutase
MLTVFQQGVPVCLVNRFAAPIIARFRGQDKGFTAMSKTEPLVGIIMGSQSDWPTMKRAVQTLEELEVTCESRIISAHRTPERHFKYVESAEQRGLKVIIAGAGMAAHLAGVTAALTKLPVLGVPIESKALKGMDSLLSTVMMPAGIAVGTLAIGGSGAANAGLFAAQIIALGDEALAKRIVAWREAQTAGVPEIPVDTP